jgi:antitoxin FitA
MPAIHIRNVPEETLAALKRRAAENHRSLQMELRHILEAAASEAPAAAPRSSIGDELIMARDVPPADNQWSRDEIYEDDGR